MNHIAKNELKESFTTVTNEVINSDLSAQALALYVFMASKPIGWTFHNSYLRKRFGWSDKTLKKYIDELVDTGLILKEEQDKDLDTGKYVSCGYDVLSKPFVKIPIGKNSDGETVRKNSVLSNTNNKSIEQLYNFDSFWADYGYKKGRAKCEKKFNGLSSKDKLKIKQTLPIYISETCTTESKGNWKPMRKYPLTYLHQRIWDDYDEVINEKKDSSQLSPEERQGYDTYTEWVKKNHDPILKSIKYLSPSQYIEYKKDYRGLGETMKFRFLKESHNEWYQDEGVEVFDFFMGKINCHLKEMAA